MVQAYRDTWELGLHSYLTYLRDRLKIARELLTPSGSVFVQISDENVHHVREVMDEVFGAEDFCGLIQFVKTSGLESVTRLASACDYLMWYAKDGERVKFRQLWTTKTVQNASGYSFRETTEGERRRIRPEEAAGEMPLPEHAKYFTFSDLTKPGPGDVVFNGRTYTSGGRWWGTTPDSMAKLIAAGRIAALGNSLRFVRYLEDFPLTALSNLWEDTGIAGFASDKRYVVETSAKVLQRCLLMTTDPGDLVLDPTCGSGTTAYVAEQWGRRWITADVSRVPLALARQRLLTATFPYYELVDEARGPSGGFVYKRKQNRKGEEVGGIVPHITLKSIANNEPPEEEVLVDRPEVENSITRITGPFCFESTIPAPLDLESDSEEQSAEASGSLPARMIETCARVRCCALPVTRALRSRTFVRRPNRSRSRLKPLW